MVFATLHGPAVGASPVHMIRLRLDKCLTQPVSFSCSAARTPAHLSKARQAKLGQLCWSCSAVLAAVVLAQSGAEWSKQECKQSHDMTSLPSKELLWPVLTCRLHEGSLSLALGSRGGGCDVSKGRPSSLTCHAIKTATGSLPRTAGLRTLGKA